MANSYRSHYFHLIWSTKSRKKFIVEEIKQRLYEYIGGIARNYQAHLLSIGGTDDHIHLLISLGRLDKYTEIIKNIKSNSSQWIHKNFPKYSDFAWQDGYGSFTVSYSAIADVQNYIANQEKHHKAQSFENEYFELLNRNEIQYEDRYVLG